MLKNIYFAFCIALVGSLLCVSDTLAGDKKTSYTTAITRYVPGPIAAMIAGYLDPNEHIVLEDSKRTYNYNTQEKPNLAYTGITLFRFSANGSDKIMITNASMTYIHDKTSAIRVSEICSPVDSYEKLCEGKPAQKTKTDEAQKLFPEFVPTNADASFFPGKGTLANQGILIIANSKTFTAYDTTNTASPQSYQAIYDALNPRPKRTAHSVCPEMIGIAGAAKLYFWNKSRQTTK